MMMMMQVDYLLNFCVFLQSWTDWNFYAVWPKKLIMGRRKAILVFSLVYWALCCLLEKSLECRIAIPKCFELWLFLYFLFMCAFVSIDFCLHCATHLCFCQYYFWFIASSLVCIHYYWAYAIYMSCVCW